MVTDPSQINAIYRLWHEEKWSFRRIARELHVARKTIKKFLLSPAGPPVVRKPRKTKLDDFKPVIRELVERDPKASAVVIAERIRPLGFAGESTILRRYVKTLREIVRYPRSWRRGQTFGAERFEKELLEQRPGAEGTRGQQRLIAFVGPIGESYLRGLADTDRSMTHQLRALLALVRQYDPDAVASALAKAQAAGAFGADYVANILLQEHSPREQQPPLRLKDPRLNELVTDPLSLLEYDALILSQRRQS
jgi:hypothetical protein